MLGKIISFLLIFSFTVSSVVRADEITVEEKAVEICEKKPSFNRNKIIKIALLSVVCLTGVYFVNYCKDEAQLRAFMNSLGIVGFSMTVYDFVEDDEAGLKKTNNLLKEGKGLLKEFKIKPEKA